MLGIVSNGKLCSREVQANANDSIAVVWLVLPLLVQQQLAPGRKTRSLNTQTVRISTSL